MKKFRVTGIGEVLWDMLPDGKMLGGAPANFSYHTRKLGADSAIISATGNDDLGYELVNILNEKEIHHFLNHPNYPTGTVSVILKDGIPAYEIHQNVAWDHIQLSDEAAKWIQTTDALCFGSISQRSKVSAKAIDQALNLAPDHALKILDVNLRQQFYSKDLLEKSFKKANIVKLNEEEIEIIGSLFKLSGTHLEKCRTLLAKFHLDVVALTMGEKGSCLMTKTEESVMPVPEVSVVDTIGAGDSFTAVMVMGLLNKKPLNILHTEAAEYAARVCTFRGAMPDF